MAFQRIKRGTKAARRAGLDRAVLSRYPLPEFIQKMCVRKIRYNSEGDALAMLSVMCGRKDGKPGRVYLCEHCDGYHITSKLALATPQAEGR